MQLRLIAMAPVVSMIRARCGPEDRVDEARAQEHFHRERLAPM